MFNKTYMEKKNGRIFGENKIAYEKSSVVI